MTLYDRQDMVCSCPEWALSEETEYINLLLKISNKIKNKFNKDMKSIFGSEIFYLSPNKTHHRMLTKNKYDYRNELLPKSSKNLDVVRGTINCDSIETLIENFEKLMEISHKNNTVDTPTVDNNNNNNNNNINDKPFDAVTMNRNNSNSTNTVNTATGNNNNNYRKGSHNYSGTETDDDGIRIQYENSVNNYHRMSKLINRNVYHLQIAKIDNGFLPKSANITTIDENNVTIKPISRAHKDTVQSSFNDSMGDLNASLTIMVEKEDGTSNEVNNNNNNNNTNNNKDNTSFPSPTPSDTAHAKFKMTVTSESGGDLLSDAYTIASSALSANATTATATTTAAGTRKHTKRGSGSGGASGVSINTMDVIRSISEEFRSIIVNVVIEVPGQHKFRIDRELKDSLNVEFDSESDNKNSLRMICELQFLLNDYLNIKKEMHLFEKIARSHTKNDLWAQCAKYWI